MYDQDLYADPAAFTSAYEEALAGYENEGYGQENDMMYEDGYENYGYYGGAGFDEENEL